MSDKSKKGDVYFWDNNSEELMKWLQERYTDSVAAAGICAGACVSILASATRENVDSGASEETLRRLARKFADKMVEEALRMYWSGKSS